MIRENKLEATSQFFGVILLSLRGMQGSGVRVEGIRVEGVRFRVHGFRFGVSYSIKPLFNRISLAFRRMCTDHHTFKDAYLTGMGFRLRVACEVGLLLWFQ